MTGGVCPASRSGIIRHVTTNARLRVIVQLADCGSVHAAAAALSVSESAVSAAVSALSRDLDVPLLAKDGRGIRLTSAGERYVGYARQILGMHAEAVAAARSEDDPERGLVRLAAVTTAGEHVLPDLLVSFRDRHPGVGLHLEVQARDAVWPMLVNHEVDLAVAGRPTGDLPVRVRAESPNTLVVVGAPPSAVDFAPHRATWLMREPGSGTRATCLVLLAALDASPPQLTLGSHGAAVAAAVAGLGVTLASEQAVAPHVRAGRLVTLPVPGTPLERPWRLVTGSSPTPTAELLVAHVLERPDWSVPR